jgi:foldase protein PrsA
MKTSRSTATLGALFVLAAAVAGCGSGIAGNSVADMAGNPITTAAVNHWMYVAAKGLASQNPGAPVIVPTDPPSFTNCISLARKEIPSVAKESNSQLRTACGQLFTSLSSQVMDFLIRAYWYQADAVKLHINVTDSQVQKEFTKDKQQAYPTASGFQAFLTQTGQTLPDILFRVRVNLIFKQLIAKHNTKVTPAAIQAYYQSHLSQFGTPESRDIRIVLTKTAARAAAAKAALTSGQSWSKVAKKYSIDQATRNAGGLLPGVTKGQQDAALDTAAFSTTPGKILGPVHGQFGYYVFEVTKITPATQQTLAQATAAIQATLTSQAQTSAQTAVDAQAKKDWLSQTKCRAPYAMADCSGYKPPKSTATPFGTSSTG